MKKTVWVMVALAFGLTVGCSSSSERSDDQSVTAGTDSIEGNDATTSQTAADGADGVDGSSTADGADGADGVTATTGPDDCAKTAPSGAPCNPYCQTGCSEGQACTVLNSSFACAGSGGLEIGADCTGTQCGEGLACFGINEDGGASKCRQFCIDDSDCPDGRRCSLNVSFPSGASASFCGEVEVGCSVFDEPSTCPEGQACYLINGATKCAEAGALEAGTLCNGQPPGSCAPGLQCLIECVEVCSSDGSQGPACADTCDEGQVQVVNQANAIGVCLTSDPPQECNLFTQTGCEAGEGCYPFTAGWACSNSGGIAVGEACSGSQDCVAGAACISSQCQQLCSTREDADESVSCEALCESSNGLNPTAWGVGFCTDAEPAVPCDYWAQDCTEAGTACYFVNNGATCLPTQVDGKLGDSCGSLTECGKGLLCVSNTCSEVCSIDEFAPPPAPICVDVCPNGQFSPYGSFDNQIGICAG